MSACAHTTVDSPVGKLWLLARDGALVMLWFDADTRGAAATPADAVEDAAHPVLVAAARQLDGYFQGRRTVFDVPLRPAGTPFQQRCWEALRTIPHGTTRSYGEQAARMGDAGKARAVGAANGRNPIGILIPCHRVVGSNGDLVGFGGGLQRKRWLLEHERAHVQPRLF